MGLRSPPRSAPWGRHCHSVQTSEENTHLAEEDKTPQIQIKTGPSEVAAHLGTRLEAAKAGGLCVRSAGGAREIRRSRNAPRSKRALEKLPAGSASTSPSQPPPLCRERSLAGPERDRGPRPPVASQGPRLVLTHPDPDPPAPSQGGVGGWPRVTSLGSHIWMMRDLRGSVFRN